MADNGGNPDEGDKYEAGNDDLEEPMPRSQYFGNPDVDDISEDDMNDADLAAYADFDENANFDVLPPFANHRNKVLDQQVKSKEKKVQLLGDELEENTERVGIMADHLKNVEQEHLHTQALLDAKTREIETEDHLKQLAERERGRIRTDDEKLEKYMLECQDQLNSIQNAMFAANEKLEQFKLQMNWNQEELLQWSLAAKQKDEDRAALEKYGALDSVKIKNLTLKMKKSARSVQEKKSELDDMVTESQAVQIELDKTADEYRKLHLQRQDLIQQWNSAMEAMHKRDQAIAAVGEQIGGVKVEVRDRERILNEEKEFLASEEANNKQLTVSIAAADRQSEKKRTILMANRHENVEFNDEVSTQRNELEKAETELSKTKTMNENLNELKEDKAKRLEDFKGQLDNTKTKLQNEYATTDDLAERSKQVDLLHKQHEDRLKAVNKELQYLKQSMFNHSHQLFNLRKEEANLIAEISGAQGTSRNLQARIHELDQRSLKQQEMLYNIEFQVQQLERKVSHASGKRSLEETMRLNAEIAVLQKALEDNQAQNSMITSQVKRLHDDLRAARRKMTDVVSERDQLAEKISAVELENESSALEVKDAVKRKEETVVSHDVLKLEVKRLRTTLNQKADEVLALENRKLQLELSMKERQKEVDLHKEVQKAEGKQAEEARHNLAMDLKERQIKVDKLKRKFETIAGNLKSTDDTEERSQAYYIIQAAQEREELQKEGDQLNTDIRTAEKEIRMLTRTLQHLNQRNQSYRESFHKADMSGSDAKLKADLEEQHRSVADSLYKKKSYLREIVTDFEERKRILNQLVNNIGGLQAETGQIEKELRDVERQVSEQEEQLNRASREMLSKREDFLASRGLSENDVTPEEMHITLQEKKRKNRVLLNLLRNFAEDNPSMMDQVLMTLEDVGLNLGPMKDRPASSGTAGGRSRRGRPDTGGSIGSRGSRPGSSRFDGNNLPPLTPERNNYMSSGRRPQSGTGSDGRPSSRSSNRR